MQQKITTHNKEKQLLETREKGRQDALLVNAMNAHGKVLGMDCFSWMNPQIDSLASVIESLPFQIIWVGRHDQIKSCLEIYPDLTHSIKSAIIMDSTLLHLNRDTLNQLSNIACIEGTENAFELLKTMKREKSVFLFTSNGEDAKKDKELFEKFISLFK